MCPPGHTHECCWYGHIRHHSITQLPENLLWLMREVAMVLLVSIALIFWFLLMVCASPFDIIDRLWRVSSNLVYRLFRLSPDKSPSEPR